ncbi:hypothetical protein [Williamsia sp. CHRR-6]|uniref:hypothetical protein n=1 Tax=Williamsia sp. CHRR-6 TaxID=2835871 RepID=UPI001BDB0335|nr:hypothetical protein [Williamsia sp. CHRR-6]MBT0566901.1 hypothetical protein [Williamsia sp. CHRR-6]
MPEQTLDTDLFGDVVLRSGDGVVEAVSVDEPACRVTLRRRGEVTHERTPLGTRDPEAVEIDLPGAKVTVRPRRARFTKRSYRVDIEVDGVALDLSPRDDVCCEFRLSTLDVAHNVFAELTRHGDGTVELIWSPPVRLGHRTFDPPVPSREQLLVALTVAAAFGTGGLSLLTIASNAVDAMLP